MAGVSVREDRAPSGETVVDSRMAAILYDLFMESPEAVVLAGPDGRCLAANPAALRLLRREQDELPRLNIARLLRPVLAVDAHPAPLDDPTRPWHGRGTLLAQDGAIQPIDVRVVTVSGPAAGTQVWYLRATPPEPADDPRARLAAMVVSCADAIIGETLDGLITDWNPAAERLYGYSAAEAIGQPLLILAPAGREQEIDDLLERVGHGESISNLEAVRRAKDGRLIDVSVSVFPVRDDAGKIVGASSVTRDIMAHARLVQELRASEARYRSLLEHVPAALYLLAANQERIYYSPYFEQLTGYNPDTALPEFADQHWLEFVHPEDRARVAVQDARTDDAESPFRSEYRIRRADGSYVWVQDDCVPVFDAGGTLVAWQGVLLDISDRIAAEEEHARLAAIVASSEEAIFSTHDGIITSWNRGAEQMYGYPADEMIGQSVSRLLPDGQPEPELVRAVQAGTWATRIETTRWRRDGSTFDAAISLSPIRDRNGEVIGISSITQDISTRKQADAALQAALEEARAATQARSRFLAMVTHELRTPLQAILGYSELLLNGSVASLAPEQREDIGYIHQGARRMAALIDDLLDLSRMDAGRLEMAAEPVDLSEVIEQVRQDVAPQVAARNLDLTISVPARLVPVLGDSGRIRQILLNLAGNAVKFTDEGGIELVATEQDGGVAVAVRDTGVGISPDDLPVIFEEFRQVGRGSAHRPGIGLGLPICLRLTEQMGGRITVSSALGEGSTFTLWLPAAPVAASATRAVSRQNGHTRI